ncbi:hypothetical protein C8F01DRAFT_1084715 [Mycena amicta]|nr:hypothetical protein C8F01DRAFT_1084715 [Mycena amicta]
MDLLRGAMNVACSTTTSATILSVATRLTTGFPGTLSAHFQAAFKQCLHLMLLLQRCLTGLHSRRMNGSLRPVGLGQKRVADSQRSLDFLLPVLRRIEPTNLDGPTALLEAVADLPQGSPGVLCGPDGRRRTGGWRAGKGFVDEGVYSLIDHIPVLWPDWLSATATCASAVLTFTGVAVYFLSPRWPYAVTTQLSLDDSTVVLDLTDHNASSTPPGGSESTPSSIVWSATGLTNSLHTVVVRMASGGQFAVVDGFITTVVDSDFDSSMRTTSPSSSSPIPSPSFTSIHGHSRPAALRLPLLRILAIVVGVLDVPDGHAQAEGWARAAETVDGIPVPFVVGADEQGLGSRARPALRDSESARSTLVGIVTVVEDSDKLSSSESDFVSAPGVTQGPRPAGTGAGTTLASAFKALAARKTHIKTDEEEGASAGEGLSLQILWDLLYGLLDSYSRTVGAVSDDRTHDEQAYKRKRFLPVPYENSTTETKATVI